MTRSAHFLGQNFPFPASRQNLPYLGSRNNCHILCDYLPSGPPSNCNHVCVCAEFPIQSMKWTYIILCLHVCVYMYACVRRGILGRFCVENTWEKCREADVGSSCYRLFLPLNFLYCWPNARPSVFTERCCAAIRAHTHTQCTLDAQPLDLILWSSRVK